MGKWTVAYEKNSETEYRLFCPAYPHIVVEADSLESGISELKDQISFFLEKNPADLQLFQQLSAQIRLRKLN